jgi:hypothetical protein
VLLLDQFAVYQFEPSLISKPTEPPEQSVPAVAVVELPRVQESLTKNFPDVRVLEVEL